MTLQEIASDSDRNVVVKLGVSCLGDDLCFQIEVIETELRKKQSGSVNTRRQEAKYKSI